MVYSGLNSAQNDFHRLNTMGLRDLGTNSTQVPISRKDTGGAFGLHRGGPKEDGPKREPMADLHMPVLNSSFVVRFDPSADSQLGLDALRYPERAIDLLTEYFDDQLDQSGQAELAGLLVFPSNQVGADLYARLQESSGTKLERNLLQTIAQYPTEEPFSRLLEATFRAPDQVSLEDRVKLYVHRRFASWNTEAKLLASELKKQVSSWESGKLEEKQLARILASRVKSEMAEGSIAYPEEVGDLFGIKKGKVEHLLAHPVHGLTDGEQLQRQQLLDERTQREAEALPRLVAEAVRSFARVENSLVGSRAIEAPSKSEKLAELFGVSKPEMRRCLGTLDDQEFATREERLVGEEEYQERRYIIQTVKRALEAHRQERIDELSSDTELAKGVKLQPVSVYHLLRRELSRHELQERERILSRQENEQEPHRESPIGFVRAELEAFKRGEINWICTDKELANLFGRSEIELQRDLFSGEKPLSESELRCREMVWYGRQRESIFSGVQERVVADNIRGALLDKMEAELEQENEEVRDRWNYGVQIDGHEFGSKEEAVCGLMLERYIPGFKLELGKTFQIPVNGGRVDFRVNDEFIEYHPIRPIYSKKYGGDFDSKEESEMYHSIKDSTELPALEKKKMLEDIRANVATRYRNRRKDLLEGSAEHRGSSITVVFSSDEFLELVLNRHAEAVISKSRFKRLWNAFSRIVDREKRRIEKEKRAA